MSATHSSVKWTPLGYFQASVTGAAQGLVALIGQAIPTDTLMALIEIEGAGVRWRDDGTAPTATVGMPVAAGQEWQYSVVDFTKVQFIQQSAGALINVSFYK